MQTRTCRVTVPGEIVREVSRGGCSKGGPGKVLAISLTALLAFAATPAAGQEIEWTRQFGTEVRDRARGVSVRGSDVYVAGHTSGALPDQASGVGTDAFVRKYDTLGNHIWTRQFGASVSALALAIFVDDSGVYVAGFTNGPFPGQVSTGILDAFVRKYDHDGNHAWTRQFGTPDLALALGISAGAGGVYVAGYTDGGAIPGQASPGGEDAFVRKYDHDGNHAWTRQFGTPADDRATGISVDASGAYVAGHTGGALPGQLPHGSVDAFVRKYDPDGAVLWTRQSGSPLRTLASGISVDASGVYAGGFVDGALPGQVSQGDFDAFIVKYNGDGTLVWTRQFGTPAFDEPLAIFADGSGPILAGRTMGTFSGQTSAGDSDVFVRKVHADGNGVWTIQFGSPAFDRAAGVSADAGGVYLAGHADGALPTQIGLGDSDAFAAKVTNGGTAGIVIDIKPDDFPNSINLRSRGVVPVAILSSDTFAATTVDPSTVLLAGAPVKVRAKGRPIAALKDVDGDGLLDLIVHIQTEDLLLARTDTEATLTGETFGGLSFSGLDSVRVVPR